MITVSKAEQGRLTIHGLMEGEPYCIQKQTGGWWVSLQKVRRQLKTGMSAEAFDKLYQSRKPLDAAAASEIAANIAAMK